ncbi:MAG: hypothetical protein HOL98_14335 [Gammaproteobacteria bacterium]|jgi:rifampicin phosphotransferase|nr:hypothetical protein [Gammaproteobacteria bacterium]MBT5204633.1 hypothetical protein [Gammaproteobacteria bacterium]MBT5600698.1 hypothetical protein [Gammaproteobacteria bacterium]MBT6244476.1 hypothetical protein [Gammaproteobacteria bacterium]
MAPTLFSFSSPKLPKQSEVGGKALSLISSTLAGLPVPRGLALSVAFFQPWTESIKSGSDWRALLENPSREHCDAVKAMAQQLTFTEEQRYQLNAAMMELEGVSIFAVRSSSPEEDLEGSSFAGMYETFLGTRRDQLEGNIAKAYASMFDFRVMEYKTQNGLELESSCISIVVQQQVASDISGVGFSLNPLNNCYDEAVINASFGLGEAIVSGIVTPDNYVIEKVSMELLEKTVNNKAIALKLADKGGIEQFENPLPTAQALTDSQIMSLTELIKLCESHYQFPVDIEWAFENDTLHLLQARPVTGYVPLFPELRTLPGEPKRLYMDIMPLTQGFDAPLSVLGGDIWAMVLDRLKQGSFPAGEDGYLLNLHGRQYFLLHNLFKGLGKKLGARILSSYDNAFEGREEETYREYIAQNVTSLMKQGKKAQLRMIFTMLPAMVKVILNPVKRAEEFEDVVHGLMRKFKALENDRLYNELVDSVFDAFQEVIEKMIIFVPGLLADRKVTKMFAGTEVEDLVDSVLMDVPSNPTSAMGHAMFALASFEDFKATIDAGEFEQRLAERNYSPGFLSAWDDYHYKYGERGFKEIDVASMRMYEKRSEFFAQLKSINLEENQMLRVKARKQEALTRMQAVANKKGKLKAFNKAVDTINLVYGHRETPKYLVVIMNGNLRRVALEIADEFIAQGRLQNREQIFDLHKEQIGQAQQDPSLQLLPLIEQNLRPYQAMQHVKHYPCFIDSRGKIFRKINLAEDGDLVGQAVSSGVVTGKAKVLASPYEKPLEPGEILVTVATEPAWTPVFVNASGVVLEVGGGLQHGAIIAREYGIPCVSGLPGVTDMIKDGDLLEVDGTNGIVKIVEAA